MNLQDEQAPIDSEIVREAIASTPEHWESFNLKLEYIFDEDPDALGIVKTTLTSDDAFTVPDSDLLVAVQKLNKLFYRYGVVWISAEYNISSTDDGKWKYEADFQY